jgi:hypothetical protein
MVFTAANGNWAKKFTILRDYARTAALALMHHEAPQKCNRGLHKIRAYFLHRISLIFIESSFILNGF